MKNIINYLKKNQHVIIIILLIIYFLFFNKNNFLEGIEPITEKNNDYYMQPFKYDISKKHWNAAHSGMKKRLKKWSYTTYDGAYKVTSKTTYKPESLADIVDIINKHKKIKASGGHHTFNDIALSDDVIIKTYNLKKISLDKRNMNYVICGSGLLLEDINIFLQKNNLGIPVLPAIPYQSIAGALATSSHGSNIDHGSMSSLVVSMIIVGGNGVIYRLSKNKIEILDKKEQVIRSENKKNNDMFKAAITNLGSLGVVYSVILKCDPLFAIDNTTEFMSINNFITRSDKLLKENEYMQAYLYPLKKGKKQTRVYKRKKIPVTISDINKNRKLNQGKDIKSISKKIDYSHRVLTKNLEASYYTETEIAVPKDSWKDALQEIIELFEDMDKDGYRTKYPILVRFTGKDNSLIGMTAGRDSVFFDIFDKTSNKCKKGLRKLFGSFYNILVNKYKGRPHYGKRHCLNYKDMVKIYGIENIERFNKVRKIMDPKDIFTNEYTSRLLDNKKGVNVCTFGCK